MNKKNSSILFPLFALFIIFADEVFFCYMAASGTIVESGMKSKEAIFVAAVAYSMLFMDIANHKLSSRNYRQLFALLGIMILYYITQFFFPEGMKMPNYTAHLLVYGALCVPAAYVGMRLARMGGDEKMIDLLPIYVIPVALIVGSAAAITSAAGTLLTNEESAFNYQSASYYLAYCFSYSVFFVFLYDHGKQHKGGKLLSFVMFIMLFVCAVGCVLGGGRGAFVYLVLIGIYLVYRIIHKKGKRKTNANTILLLGITAIIAVVLASRFNIFDSAGFTRVSENLTSDDNRDALWQSAIKAFKESPILGHGLGSIWWTVGFYSHSMFTDILAETGIVGTAIFLWVLVRCFLTLLRRSKFSQFDFFIFLIFCGVFVECSFSGYWISSPKLFLIFGYVFGLTPLERKAKSSVSKVSL